MATPGVRPRTWPIGPSVVRLAVAVVERLKPREQPDATEVDLVGARVVADVVRLTGPVREVRDPVGAGDDRVRGARPGWPCDHVAGAELVRLALRAARGR